MSNITKNNFHLKTKANFNFIKFGSPAYDIFNSLVNEFGLFFKSHSGSKYVIAGDVVYRLSDHWGSVASCRWYLVGCPEFYGKKDVLASCKLSDFVDMKKPVEYVLFNGTNIKNGKSGQYGISRSEFTNEFMNHFSNVTNFRTETHFE